MRDLGGDERFSWPPRKPAESSSDEVDLEVGSPQHDRGAALAVYGPSTASRLWMDLERDLLDLRTPGLTTRLVESGWRPDPVNGACHRCGVTVGQGELQPDGCGECRGLLFPWSRFVRLGEYRGELRSAVQDVKFTRWRRLGRDLGRLLGGVICGEIERVHPVQRIGVVAVPAPISFVRRFERGIDHTRAIARGVVDVTGGSVVSLLRRSHRSSQVQVPPSQRAANVSGAIGSAWGAAARLGRAVKGLRRRGVERVVLVVVDDVVTSGATMRSCGRAVATVVKEWSEPVGLADAGKGPAVEVWATAVARAELSGARPARKRRENVRGQEADDQGSG